MAASAEIITKPVASAISLRWIIGARDDLIWFIGSVVSSYVLLFLYVRGIVPWFRWLRLVGHSDRRAARFRHVLTHLLRSH